jgi:hypothetical protein
MKLPEGWKAAPLYNTDRWVLLEQVDPGPDSPGMVTLDLELRGYRFGMVVTGRLDGSRGIRFNGRGWKQKLCETAIQHLVEAPKPKRRRKR